MKLRHKKFKAVKILMEQVGYWCTQDVKSVSQRSILGDRDPINKYYAYGIWNNFGIDIDPETRKVWDTENGVIFVIKLT